MNWYAKEKHRFKLEINMEHRLKRLCSLHSIAGVLDWWLKTGPQYSGSHPLSKCSTKKL